MEITVKIDPVEVTALVRLFLSTRPGNGPLDPEQVPPAAKARGEPGR
jgi:hypothetical protein